MKKKKITVGTCMAAYTVTGSKKNDNSRAMVLSCCLYNLFTNIITNSKLQTLIVLCNTVRITFTNILFIYLSKCFYRY